MSLLLEVTFTHVVTFRTEILVLSVQSLNGEVENGRGEFWTAECPVQGPEEVLHVISVCRRWRIRSR